MNNATSHWRRHAQQWRAAWSQRASGKALAATRDAQAFLPAALSVQAVPPHPLPLWTARSLMALFAALLAWACLGRVDIVAVASGRVIAAQRSQRIQSLGDGLVHKLWVRDGDRVQAGQLLLQLDATDAQAERERIQEAWRAASSEDWRAQALLSAMERGALLRGAVAPASAGVPDRALTWTLGDAQRAEALLRAEWADIQGRLARSQAEVQQRQSEGDTAHAVFDKLQSRLPWARRREADYRLLVEKGFISGHATEDRTRERIELERDLAAQAARLREVAAARVHAVQSLSALRAEIRRSLHERATQARTQREQLLAEATKAWQRQRLTELRSPVKGTVQQLQVHAPGVVVTAGQELMVVASDADRLTAQVAIANQDMGFVHQGQAVTVKLEAFPFTRHGTLPATVAVLGADAAVDQRSGQATYPAHLTLERSSLLVDGREVALTPGMNLTAEIKTGRRRLIDYLLSPVQSLADESLRER